MHLVDFVLIALLAAGIFFAVRHAWRNRGGCCGGGCAGCKKSCAKRGGVR
ncbi:MAG TPA: FeoB-associated Cys-rich membrane protein [Candidatus Pygmaiobacter gallistercoris]|nr:FeoB-associated Cys-rich membrane protein [Candidatus Pygmaiobacter gallistercoris]